jgi:predicted MFS family arabinose efflux permease
VAQFLRGLGEGLTYPTWVRLWNIHLDRNRESFEWTLHSTLTGLATALTAALGAAMAQYIGFPHTFILVGMMSFAGLLVLLKLEKDEQEK